MALLESNFENRLSFVEESCYFFFIIMFFALKRLKVLQISQNTICSEGGTKMKLHRELSYGQPNGCPRRAILVLFFSQCTLPF